MKRTIVAALLASAALAHAQTASAPAPASAAAAPVSAAKKELVQKVLALQQPGIENIARSLVEQPAGQMIQAAGRALQQVPADKRESVGKGIEADVKKFVDEAFPIVRERAVKVAPSTIGSVLEEKFSEDELKQLAAWLESPVNKKYLQLGPDMQNVFMQKLVAEVRPLLDPKLQALDGRVRSALGVPAGSASGVPAASASAPAKAAPPARKASAK